MSAAVDEIALIRRALCGEEEAARALTHRLMPVIRARVRRALAGDRRRLDASDGDDLVQEIWLKVIEGEGRQLLAFDPSRSMSLEGYVGMIAEREVGNHLRKAASKKRGGHLTRVVADELAAETPTPEDHAQAGDLAARLGRHLEAELPARGWLVFRYAFTDELAPDEVARIMGVTVQVVYNWQHKIRAAARTFFGAEVRI